MTELKLCPFCGSDNIDPTCITEPGHDYCVVCQECNAGGPQEGSRKLAIEAWNDREFKL